MTVYDWMEKPRVRLGGTGCEPPLSELEEGFISTIHRFARDVVRPVGEELDTMTPEQVIREGSPYWDFRKSYLELGLNPVNLGELSDEERGRLMPMVFEELGWGDGGLAVTIGACQLPPGLSLLLEKPHLLERFPVDLIGCWAITEPDHGSDMIDPGREIFHARGAYGRPNCVVAFEGDTLVINGQKSAWVSNGPIADVCVLYSACDSGDGPDSEYGCVVIVPMDAPGVSRGRSIDKLGQRALPQGEVYFDNVRLPTEYLLAGPEHYSRAVYAVHAEANTQMGAIFTGVARAAFELAWQYAHDRKQGGVPIIRHQSVQQRLFHM
jgi:alkylation response protein AidB-like acyl-CoA dehydrogenase